MPHPTTPVAYFLTFATYGSRLPGDYFPAVSRHANAVGTPTIGDRPGLAYRMQELLRHRPVMLDQPMRLSVERTIQERCRFSNWELHALNVRTNHVHVVLTAQELAPVVVLARLKARATRILREEGLVGRDVPVWAEHGSTKVVWDEEGLIEVVDYVLYRQGGPLT